MEFSSSEVMAYILYQGKQAEHPINKTQAQKLLYCCYGAVLAAFDERLTDEHPYAWPFGPVFPRTLNAINQRQLKVGMARNFESDCPTEVLELINRTIHTFWNYSASALTTWSHRTGSPWTKADPLAPLDDREIQKYFKNYLGIINSKAEETCQTTPL